MKDQQPTPPPQTNPTHENTGAQSFTDEQHEPNEDRGEAKPRKPKCGAKREHKGLGPCGNPAGFKTDHSGNGPCKYHGGNTPTVRKYYAKLRLEQGMVTLGLPREIPAEQGLIEEIHRAAGHVAWLELRVRAMDESDLVWGAVEAKRLMRAENVNDLTGGDGEPTPLYEVVMKAGANAWLTLYQQERDRLARACALAIKCDVEQRKVRLAERQGMQLAAVVRQFVIELGLPADTMTRVPHALSVALSKVTGPMDSVDGEVVPAAVLAIPSALDVERA